MSDNDIQHFQAALAPRLSAIHGGVETKPEWAAMAGQVGLYSPRLDIAVGPFATGDLNYINEFEELLHKYREFVHHLYQQSNENLDKFGEAAEKFEFDDVVHWNANSRCYLAFEIENKVSRKHLMGGAINAAALGRVGIAVGWTEEKVRAFVKLRTYLLYLASVGKNTFHPKNLLVLSREQLASAVEEFEPV